QAEQGEHDAFEQEGLPVRLHPGGHFGLQLADAWRDVLRAILGKGHWKLPIPVASTELPNIVRAPLTGKICCWIFLSEINDGRTAFSLARARTKSPPRRS